MKHDYSDPDYQSALLDLFQPGSGVIPPALAGREVPLGLLDGFLRPLREDQGPARDVILYGPRGNGKTVLLESCERRAQEQGIQLVSLDADEVRTETALAMNLLYNDDTVLGDLLDQVRASAAELGLPGIGKVSWQQLSPDEKDRQRVRHLSGLLAARCRKAPLLVTIDEAHTLDVAVGKRLLNLSQKVRRKGTPFLLVLAGTPDLEGHLGRMGATFWGRSKVLPIGRLSEAATRDALVRPLAGLSVEVEPAALDEVVAESQRYPYFIQLWGKALCAGLVQAEAGHTVTPDTVARAAPAVAESRIRYYGQRYEEMRARHLLPAADGVASIFERRESVPKGTLAELVSRDLSVDEDTALGWLDQLSDLGYLWRPTGSATCEPGIPSLMTYVRDERQAELKARADFDRPEAPGSRP